MSDKWKNDFEKWFMDEFDRMPNISNVKDKLVWDGFKGARGYDSARERETTADMMKVTFTVTVNYDGTYYLGLWASGCGHPRDDQHVYTAIIPMPTKIADIIRRTKEEHEIKYGTCVEGEITETGGG